MHYDNNRFSSTYTGRLSPATGDVRQIPPELLAVIASHAVIVRARRRQNLSVAVDGVETVYLVKSGLLILANSEEAEKSRVLSVYYGGDVFRSAFAPPFANSSLVSVASSELLRLPYHTFISLAERHPAIAAFFADRSAGLQARSGLHIAALSSLSGEARTVTFLTELALRIGVLNGRQVAFEMPLSRSDIANYLALNADTLSRIMSKLRADGLVTAIGRGRLIVRSIDELLSRTPFAETLKLLHNAD